MKEKIVNYLLSKQWFISMVRQRFHSYFDWKQFNIGIGFCKTTGLAGWQYMLSIDIAQFSMWIYFKKL